MFGKNGIQVGNVEAEDIVKVVEMIEMFGNEIGKTTLRLMTKGKKIKCNSNSKEFSKNYSLRIIPNAGVQLQNMFPDKPHQITKVRSSSSETNN